MLACGLIVMLSLVADCANRDSLDQGTTSQKIENLPHQLSRVQEVSGEGLASRRADKRSLLEAVIICKAKERDVAQLQACEVSQQRFCELKSLFRQEITMLSGLLRGRRDVVLIGGYSRMNQ